MLRQTANQPTAWQPLHVIRHVGKDGKDDSKLKASIRIRERGKHLLMFGSTGHNEAGWLETIVGRKHEFITAGYS